MNAWMNSKIFLERIDKLAYLETGGHILLIDSKRNGFKFIEKYKRVAVSILIC